jgi:hypothetical protein
MNAQVLSSPPDTHKHCRRKRDASDHLSTSDEQRHPRRNPTARRSKTEAKARGCVTPECGKARSECGRSGREHRRPRGATTSGARGERPMVVHRESGGRRKRRTTATVQNHRSGGRDKWNFTWNSSTGVKHGRPQRGGRRRDGGRGEERFTNNPNGNEIPSGGLSCSQPTT